MAYEIKIIGDNDIIVLPTEKGIKVKAWYEDKSVPKDTVLNLGDVSVTKGQIRMIKQVADTRATSKDGNKVVDDTMREQRKIYLEWVVKTPEQKSNRDQLFIQCYRVINGRTPSDDILNAYKQDAVEFFKENPKRTYPDSPVYINHFGKGVEKKAISKFRFSMLKILERVIGEDMHSAK